MTHLGRCTVHRTTLNETLLLHRFKELHGSAILQESYVHVMILQLLVFKSDCLSLHSFVTKIHYVKCIVLPYFPLH